MVSLRASLKAFLKNLFELFALFEKRKGHIHEKGNSTRSVGFELAAQAVALTPALSATETRSSVCPPALFYMYVVCSDVCKSR